LSKAARTPESDKMRKRVLSPAEDGMAPPSDYWLPLEECTEVEITSEHKAHPIEAALRAEGGSGWKADAPGKQTIRFLFTNPQHVKRIWLSFAEPEAERTQEYVVRWSADRGRSFHDAVRQQWNFSPRGATAEVEDHHVDLPAVTVLELSITPDIRGGTAIASLEQLRIA
jgi:hypothetical protein